MNLQKWLITDNYLFTWKQRIKVYSIWTYVVCLLEVHIIYMAFIRNWTFHLIFISTIMTDSLISRNIVRSTFQFQLVIYEVFKLRNPPSQKIIERNTTHVEFYYIQTLFPAKTATIFTRVNPDWPIDLNNHNPSRDRYTELAYWSWFNNIQKQDDCSIYTTI